MKSTAFALILVFALGLVDAQGTCPGGTSACNCQLNNVESLRALVRMEIEAQVEAEVARRFACTGNNIIETTGNYIIFITIPLCLVYTHTHTHTHTPTLI